MSEHRLSDSKTAEIERVGDHIEVWVNDEAENTSVCLFPDEQCELIKVLQQVEELAPIRPEST